MTPIVRLGLCFCLTLAACGGKVVVDELGDGSGGTTPTGSGPALCADACAALGAKGCAGADCVARCAAVPPACTGAADTLLACLRDQAASSATCLVDACLAQRNVLQTCVATSCESPIMGPGNPGLLVGKGICGGMHEHASVCDEKGLCSCVLDVDTLDQCQESGPFLADIAAGCCGSIFPQGG